MREWVRLIAPVGTDECNFGDQRFRVHDDGSVTVPLAAVDGLTRVGGFVVAPEELQPAADGPEPEVQRISLPSAASVWKQ